MWTNIWEAPKLIVNHGNRLSRLEKELRELRDEHKSSVKDLVTLALKVERLAERENWREEMLRREMEIERTKAEAERARAEAERLRQELERQQRRLPPSPSDRADTEG